MTHIRGHTSGDTHLQKKVRTDTLHIDEMSTKILAYTWDAQTVRLCESLDEKEVKQHRGFWNNLNPAGWYKCVLPDFFSTVRSQISTYQPTLIIFHFERPPKTGEYFFSRFLRDVMRQLDYRLLESIDSELAIYTSSAGGLLLEGEELRVKKSSSNCKGNKSKTITLTLNGVGTISIAACQFSVDLKSLKEASSKKDPLIRQDALSTTNKCLNKVIRDLPKTTNHVILLGDLGYRCFNKETPRAVADQYQQEFLRANKGAYWEGQYQNHDELFKQIQSGNVYQMYEGPGNRGPSFPPTCNLTKGRTSTCLSRRSCYNTDVQPSWCNRVLYNDFSTNSRTTCDEYGVLGIDGYYSSLNGSGSGLVYAVLSIQ